MADTTPSANPSGYPVDRPAVPRATFGRLRRCARKGCRTILSMYNPGKFCGAHDDPRDLTMPTRQATSKALGGGRKNRGAGA